MQLFYCQKLEVDMVASTEIKYFVHTNTNAPQLDNVQGSMIAVLDACLVNGLSLVSVNSMTATGTTVTVNFSTAHNLLRFQVVKITGAAQAEYNGEHRILSVPTTSSITFEVATAPSASPATGTILASLPSLGWSLPFTGTGKRAYKNTDLESPYLRVVDAVDPAYSTAYAKYAKVGMVEDMTDIDTIAGHQAPYDALNPNKNWVGTGTGTSAINGWAKWFYASSGDELDGIQKSTTTPVGARGWVVIGDGENLYLLNRAGSVASTNHIPSGFGKLNSLSNIGASPYFLACSDDYTTANTLTYATTSPLSTTTTALDTKAFMLRNYKGAPVLSSANSRVIGAATASNEHSGQTIGFANAAIDIPVFSSEFMLVETGGIPRGTFKIIRWLHQRKPYSNLQTASENGRNILAVACAAFNLEGQVLFDLGAA